MSFLKILAGAAIGVGAIAAAPFTGGGSVLGAATLMTSLAGAGTVAAAAGAGIAGAAAGAAIDSNEKEKLKARDKKNVETGIKCGEAIAAKKYEKKIIALTKRLNEYKDFERNIVGLFAIGIAVANSDGKICEEEINTLDLFISGVSKIKLPAHIRIEVRKLRNNPPSIEEAIKKAKEYGCRKQDIDDVINIMVEADEIITPEEEVFIQRWKTEFRKTIIQ